MDCLGLPCISNTCGLPFFTDGRPSLPQRCTLHRVDSKSCKCGDSGRWVVDAGRWVVEETLDSLARPEFEPNAAAFASLLRACIDARDLEQGIRLHQQMIRSRHERDKLLANMLVELYGKCGALDDARSVFDMMPRRNVFSWNIMIAAYAQNRKAKEALQLFESMQLGGPEPDKFTFSIVLDSCSVVANREQAMAIHARICNTELESDAVVGTALVNMYAKCGSPELARNMFDKIHVRDVTSWNAMITAYVQHNYCKEALQLFQQLQQEGLRPDKFTFSAVLLACTSIATLEDGMSIHLSIIDSGYESDVVIGTALVSMYGKCGSVQQAVDVFLKMDHHNVASWNAMIAVYAEGGQGNIAFQLYTEMQVNAVKPDKISLISLLKVCADLVAIKQGKVIHSSVVENGFSSDVTVGTALVNMYGKCGGLDEARGVFNKIDGHDVVSWNAMITVIAQHGHGKEALQLLPKMQQQGLQPDKATFVGLLSACSRAGLLVEGHDILTCMSERYGIIPTVEHYGCMIDLLGRAGKLEEAEAFIHRIPSKANAVIWETLLAASRIHGDIERAVFLAECISDFDPQNAAPYVLLSNIYATESRWDQIERVAI